MTAPGSDVSDPLGRLVELADADASSPALVRRCLDELLKRSPGAGAATALGILARDPRIKPSSRLTIDPHDTARRRWSQRVAAAAALISSPQVAGVFHEIRDELAESPDLARDVFAQVEVHPGLQPDRRNRLRDTARPSRSPG